jgi:hypothetical protein
VKGAGIWLGAPNTVSRFENAADSRGDTLRQMEYVLERAGINFVAADDRDGELKTGPEGRAAEGAGK